MEPKVGIVVLNWNSSQDTIECIKSVMNIKYKHYILVVVDNGSNDESSIKIKRVFPEIPVIELESNLGYSAGNNVGIKYLIECGCTYILILNNDTLVDRDFLGPLVSSIEHNSRVGGVTPIIKFPDGSADFAIARTIPSLMIKVVIYGSIFKHVPFAKAVRKRHYYGYNHNRGRAVFAVSGACVLLRSEFIQQVGYLDEGVFLYEEEFILGQQMSDMGYYACVEPSSSIIHVGGSSSKKASKANLWIEFLKSERYYLNKYAAWPVYQRRVLKCVRFSELIFHCLWFKEYRNSSTFNRAFMEIDKY